MKLKIDKHKALKVVTVLDYKKDVSDIFGDFQFYLKISKCYTLSGMVWRLEVPNYLTHNKNLWTLLSEGFQYVHDKGCRYDRLMDELYKYGLFNELHKKVDGR